MEAGCESKGRLTRTCGAAGCTAPPASESKELAESGHTWGDWRVINPAQPGLAGQEERVCARCGKSESRASPPLPDKVQPPELYVQASLNGRIVSGAEVETMNKSLTLPAKWPDPLKNGQSFTYGVRYYDADGRPFHGFLKVDVNWHGAMSGTVNLFNGELEEDAWRHQVPENAVTWSNSAELSVSQPAHQPTEPAVASRYPMSKALYEGTMAYDADLQKFFRACLLKAVKDDADAQFCVGWMYWKGLGVPNSRRDVAKRYLMKSAKQGNDYAGKFLREIGD